MRSQRAMVGVREGEEEESQQIIDGTFAINLLAHMFMGTPWVKPDHLTFGYFPGFFNPNAGVVQVPVGDAHWYATQGGTSGPSTGNSRRTSNVNEIVFLAPSEDIGPQSLIYIYANSAEETSEGMMFTFRLSPQIVVNAGDSPRRIPPGGLVIEVLKGASPGLANLFLDHMFRTAEVPVVTDWYINIGRGGQFNFSPVAAPGYSRLHYNVPNGWEFGGSGVTNTRSMSFGVPLADWGEVTDFSIENLAGNVAFFGELQYPRTIKYGDQPFVIPPRSISAGIN